MCVGRGDVILQRKTNGTPEEFGGSDSEASDDEV